MIVAVVLLFADAGRGEVCQQCDVIELNHKLDEFGGVSFSQIIIWNWKPEVGRHHVEAWWIVDVSNLHLMPARCFRGYQVRFDDKLTMTAKVYRQTTTAHDPEIADRQIWHESRRRHRTTIFKANE